MTNETNYKRKAILTTGAAIAAGLTLLGLSEYDKSQNSGLESRVNETNVPISREVVGQERESSERTETNEYSPTVNYPRDALKDMQNVLYAEAANQSELARRMVIKMSLNRMGDNDYPSNLSDVIHKNNTFSCIGDKKNKNWAQAIGDSERNAYEDMVYEKCGEDIKYVTEGGELNVPWADRVIAYHDDSIQKPNTKYWNSLNKLGKIDNLIFYEEK